MKDTTTNLDNIGGLSFSYSVMCERKFWLFKNQIQMEHNSEAISIGKEIDENYYSREHKNINVEGSCIDFFKDGIVYEVKKSSHSKEFAVLQMKYYLYLLEKNGVKDVRGVLKIPEERTSETIVLTENDIQFIDSQLKKIQKILAGPIPEVERKNICRKCAYYEYCFIDE